MTQTSTPRIVRIPRRDDAFMVPYGVIDAPGHFVVDGTWGTIRPMQLAPGVRTVGELEVIDHIERGLTLVDTRRDQFYVDGTIPTAINVPAAEVLDHLGVFAPGAPTILFCNGPQCAATPEAIATLLEAGQPPESLLYYRGGVHDWVTLGLPFVTP